MQLLMECAGMQVVGVLGDYDGRPFMETGEGRDVIMVAQLDHGGEPN